MEKELIELIQSRMVTSYNEQIWAVTIVSSLCGFVIVNAKKLTKSIDFNFLAAAIWIITGVCFFFILTRFGIHLHYSRLIDKEYPLFIDLPWYLTICRWIVLVSGTLLYLTIIACMNRAAIYICKKSFSEQSYDVPGKQSVRALREDFRKTNV